MEKCHHFILFGQCHFQKIPKRHKNSYCHHVPALVFSEGVTRERGANFGICFERDTAKRESNDDTDMQRLHFIAGPQCAPVCQIDSTLAPNGSHPRQTGPTRAKRFLSVPNGSHTRQTGPIMMVPFQLRKKATARCVQQRRGPLPSRVPKGDFDLKIFGKKSSWGDRTKFHQVAAHGCEAWRRNVRWSAHATVRLVQTDLWEEYERTI